MKKEDGRKIPRDAMEYMRMQSVRLFKEGKRADEIAEFFGVTIDAAYKWKRRHKEKGIDGLKRRKAKGAEPRLNKENKKQILSWLKKSAMDFGFETPLWDCKKILKMIKREFNKTISIPSLWDTLRRWNLTPQKPEKIALERSQRKVTEWIKNEWPKIEEQRRKTQAMLYFQDESSVSLVPVLGKTWAPKGETPRVKVTGNRGSIAVSSAISPAGRMVFRIEKKNINSKTFIDFIKQIMKNHKWRKVIVVTDNAPAHAAKIVEDFIKENKDKISIYYLPTYSPDLNPDEEVWKYLKNVKLKAHQARNKDEFKPLVLSKMHSIQKKPNVIKSFFVGNILF